MSQLLRHIQPAARRRQVAAPRIHRIDGHHADAATTCDVPATTEVARGASENSVRELHRIRDAVEELLLLASAGDCLRTTGRSNDASLKKYQHEARRVVGRLRSLLGVQTPKTQRSIGKAGTAPSKVEQRVSAGPPNEPRSGMSRVQLRLTRPLVQVLAAFQEAGQKPSRLVEQVLWKDRNFRDAARILGLDDAIPANARP